MGKKGKIRFVHALFIFIFLSFIGSTTYSQDIENSFQARTSVRFSKDLAYNLRFTITPELRWKEGLELDRYQLHTGLEYRALNFLTLGAYYRIIGNTREEKQTEYLHRYQFNSVFETKLNRWKPGLRISYTNYTDDSEEEEFLRYKAFLSYNIRKCGLSPETGFEAFHQLESNSIYKYRYKLGFEYKFSKRLTLDAAYKFDYYMTQYKNRHILDLRLKVRF